MYLRDDFCFCPNDEIVGKCLEFASGKAPHNKYLIEQRGANPEKTFNQDAYGKFAEFAAKEFLAMFLSKPYEVDTKIYAANEKNWDADLGRSFGVKSTPLSMSNYVARGTNGQSSESWTFQYANASGGGGLDKGVFSLSEQETRDKYFVFTTVEHEAIKSGTKVWVRGFCRLHTLNKNKLFKDPIASYLKGKKKNIYDGDLRQLQSALAKIATEKELVST